MTDGEQAEGSHAVSNEVSIEFFLVEFVRAVVDRWRMMMLAMVTTMIPFVVFAVVAIPTYSSTGAIQLEARGQIPGQEALSEILGAAGRPQIGTEVELLKRREFQIAVFRSLRLDIGDPHFADRVRFDLELSIPGSSPLDPAIRYLRGSVKSFEKEPDTVGAVRFEISRKGEDRFIVSSEELPPLEFGVGDTVEHAGYRMVFSRPPVRDDESIEFDALSDGALYGRYRSRISIRALGTFRTPTSVIEVSSRDTDMATAQALTQALMDKFVEQSLRWQTESASKAADFIGQQLDEIKLRLQSSEDGLLTFTKGTRAVGLETQAKVAIESAGMLEAERIALSLQANGVSRVLSLLRRNPSSLSANLTASDFTDVVLVAAIDELTRTETAYAALQASLSPEHPTLRESHAKLMQQRKVVKRLFTNAQRQLNSRLEEIELHISNRLESLEGYPEKQIELSRRTRDLQVSENIYIFLLQKLQEARIVEASESTNKRVVENARFPYSRHSPKRAKVLAVGLLVSGALAVALALASYLLTTRLNTIPELERFLQRKIFASIPGDTQEPEAAESAEKGASGQQSGGAAPSRVWQDTHGRMAEAFRSLAASVALLPRKQGGNGLTVLVTSSEAGEGKSTVAANLSVAFARTGKSTCLIDLDLRKGRQHRIWSLSRGPGGGDILAELTSGDAEDVDQLIRPVVRVVQDGVSAITIGSRVPDSFALLADRGLETLVEWSRRSFDVTILDTPPAFVPETVTLASRADILLVVCRLRLVLRRSLRGALSVLGKAKTPSFLVANDVRGFGGDGYSAGYYYYYGSNYAPDEEQSDSSSTVDR